VNDPRWVAVTQKKKSILTRSSPGTWPLALSVSQYAPQQLKIQRTNSVKISELKFTIKKKHGNEDWDCIQNFYCKLHTSLEHTNERQY
jgi:hypothetical protein